MVHPSGHNWLSNYVLKRVCCFIATTRWAGIHEIGGVGSELLWTHCNLVDIVSVGWRQTPNYKSMRTFQNDILRQKKCYKK